MRLQLLPFVYQCLTNPQLEPFQELPQLLDPHLEHFLPVLAQAFLDYLHISEDLSKRPSSSLLTPLSTAICQIIYTFCKIRGEKVIVRFLGAEAKNLELLLSALEASEVAIGELPRSDGPIHSGWVWEERYVTLLWLSHLFLAPFDLATISSTDTLPAASYEANELQLPKDLPGVTQRVLPIAMKYLETAGKERDSAKALLVRMAMRKDMQQLGLLHCLVRWAISRLRNSDDVNRFDIYHYIGILSFLSGLLVSSATTAAMDPFLLPILRSVQQISNVENVAFKPVGSSALARKIMIKVLRAISITVMRHKTAELALDATEIVENTIGHMLDALADSDTPVRLAASKSLSVITMKLAPSLASQVVDAILESLDQNVLWKKLPSGESVRDLTAVNPTEWHGLILTLSHLLYRRSPPPESLPAILHALLIGLSFERRSATGVSIGTNVRDAACFGIWALARRYTTAELQAVPIKMFAAAHYDTSSSVIQLLATELVVSATLDSAGNIRRGSSAALQELIGRHPDTVAQGISVVQTVDYHAIALRSRAVHEVAMKAAELSDLYWEALFKALLGWRGIGDGDPVSRRVAAGGIQGLANVSKTTLRLARMLETITARLRDLSLRQVDERHGLTLSLANILSAAANPNEQEYEPSSLEEALSMSSGADQMSPFIMEASKAVQSLLEDASSVTYRKPELVAEAVSQLISAFVMNVKASYPTLEQMSQYRAALKPASNLLPMWLRRTEPEVITSASSALTLFLPLLGYDEGITMTERLVVSVNDVQAGRVGQGIGFIFALAAIFSDLEPDQQEAICTAISRRWHMHSDIETRVAILQSLARSTILLSNSGEFVDIISAGLDDYTNDARGDIGSLVRFEAARASAKLFATIFSDWSDQNESTTAWYASIDSFGKIYGKVLRLSAEKLDKVRAEAKSSLALLCCENM
jgi:hypothetical protein